VITINGQQFKTKQQLRERIRALRDSYANNLPISQADLHFMLDLLKRHESAAIKVGCGIKEMFVRKNMNNRGFWLRRTDGSETDFSFEMCLRDNAEPQSMKFKEACRSAIKDEIAAFKSSLFARTKCEICPINGQPITISNAHVDHAPPWTFEKIVESFIAENGILVDAVETNCNDDGVVVNEMRDKQLAARFVAHHNQRAHLRVVSKDANLGAIKRANNEALKQERKS
jgi:hypothetical protein